MIYVDLVEKIEAIENTINPLQSIVSITLWFRFFFSVEEDNDKNVISEYSEIERRHNYIINKLPMISLWVMGQGFLPTTAQPVLYKLFGLPEPDKWILPFRTVLI